MMAGFMSYFGGRRDPKQSSRDAIVTLRQQLQMIEKKEDYLQKKIDEEMKKAKANAVSNKAGELLLGLSPPARRVFGFSCSTSACPPCLRLYLCALVARLTIMAAIWYSCDGCIATEEGDGAGARAVAEHPLPARDASQHARVRQLQCREHGGDEEGRRCTQGYSRQTVRLHFLLVA